MLRGYCPNKYVLCKLGSGETFYSSEDNDCLSVAQSVVLLIPSKVLIPLTEILPNLAPLVSIGIKI